jgi:hypothetical protein
MLLFLRYFLVLLSSSFNISLTVNESLDLSHFNIPQINFPFKSGGCNLFSILSQCQTSDFTIMSENLSLCFPFENGMYP